MLEARDRRSVVVTTPTSVKSFMLKLVELLHKLDLSRTQRAEIREDEAESGGNIRCGICRAESCPLSIVL